MAGLADIAADLGAFLQEVAPEQIAKIERPRSITAEQIDAYAGGVLDFVFAKAEPGDSSQVIGEAMVVGGLAAGHDAGLHDARIAVAVVERLEQMAKAARSALTEATTDPLLQAMKQEFPKHKDFLAWLGYTNLDLIVEKHHPAQKSRINKMARSVIEGLLLKHARKQLARELRTRGRDVREDQDDSESALTEATGPSSADSKVLEVVARLGQKNKHVSAKMVAQESGKKLAATIKALNRLQAEGYLDYNLKSGYSAYEKQAR